MKKLALLAAALVATAAIRLRRREAKDTPRKSATNRLRLPGKLVDCTRSNTAGSCPGTTRPGLAASESMRVWAATFDAGSNVCAMARGPSRFSYR